MLCTSTVRIRVLKRPGGDAPSPVETRAIYTGGRVEGEPEWWPSFAEIKSVSLSLVKSSARVPVCELRPQEGVSDREVGVAAGEAGPHRPRPASQRNGATASIGWGSGGPSQSGREGRVFPGLGPSRLRSQGFPGRSHKHN